MNSSTKWIHQYCIAMCLGQKHECPFSGSRIVLWGEVLKEYHVQGLNRESKQCGDVPLARAAPRENETG